jgi:trigger factor
MEVDQLRNMFAQNPQQLESLRNSIREEKVFDKLKNEVKINEIDKEAYQKKHDEDIEA